MNIGIDISQTAFKGTGVSRYMHGLVKGLLSDSDEHTYTFFFASLRQSPPQELVEMIQPPHKLIKVPIPPTVLSLLWNTLHVVPVETFTGHQDVFISSDWTQPPTRAAKSVTIVHDMIPYVFPETSTTRTSVSLADLNVSPNIVATHKKRLSWVKKECDHIIADSKSTKQDIEKFLGIDADKISVVYPAVEVPDVSQSTQTKVQTKYSLKKPYILTVGKVEPRKNIARLIEAFAQAGLHKDMDLVIVGGKGWGNTSQPDLPKGAQSSIKFLGYVPEKDLHPLFKSAEIFCMPSLYEGFGYPVIEAMAHGTPVACSNTSSVGELAKGNAELFDPESIDEIGKALTKLHTSKTLRSELSKKGLTHANTFTQKQFAKEFLDVVSG